MTPEEQLKFRLLAAGVGVDAAAAAAWRDRYGGPLTLAEYATTNGVTLRLPGDLYVNAPIVDYPEAPELRVDRDDFYLDADGVEVPLAVIPVPAFHSRTYDAGGVTHPFTDVGVTHTDRCRVSPIAGCAWRCEFCELPFELSYRRKEPDRLIELIEIAASDPLVPARHVLVSGGTPGRKHEPWIDEVYRRIAQESRLPVDVMMPPRRDPGYPEWLRSIGVSSVSINLEVSDAERARSVTPQKSRLIGREAFLDYIERAVESFGVGNVQSLMVVGAAIEPLDSTLAGVRDLVDRGCIPVLSMFRPHPATPLADAPAATLEELHAAYEGTLAICEQIGNGVLPGPRCIPCQHNTVTLPLDSGFYVGLHEDLVAPCPTS